MAKRQYTDTTSVELFLSDISGASAISIADSYSIQFNLWVEQISKYIEEYTGRQFIADSSSSIKLYEIENSDLGELGRYRAIQNELEIDDAVSISKVEARQNIDDSFVEIAYNRIHLYPANKTPKTRILVDESATTQFYVGHQNIRVTGTWGYSSTVPDDVKFAATVLVAGVIQHSHRHQSQQQSLTMGRYSVSYVNKKQMASFEQAREILNRYQKKSVL